LRAQGQAAPLAVVEGIHLLADHIGVLTYGALKELRVLNQRHTDFLVAVSGQHLAGTALEVLPAADRLGQHIVHSTDRMDRLAQSQSPCASLGAAALTRPAASIMRCALPSRCTSVPGRTACPLTRKVTAGALPSTTRSGALPVT